MKLDTAAYHKIVNLTSSVTASPAEAGMWNKLLLPVADAKRKVQKCQSVVNLFKKLRSRGIGLNNVENFDRNDVKRGVGREERRRRLVKVSMSSKSRDAEEELQYIGVEYLNVEERMERRLGKNRESMMTFKNILQEEASRA